MTVHEKLSQTTAENPVEVDDVAPITGALITSNGIIDTYGTIIGNDLDVKLARAGLASLEPYLDDPASKAQYDYINEQLQPVQKIESTLDTIKKVLLNIAPVFLIFGWVDFFKSVRALYQAENRHSELVMNVVVNFVSAAGLTIAFALVAAGVAGFVYAAPYVIGFILGLAAARGLYYMVKHIAYAVSAARKGEDWKEHALNAVKAFFSMAINTLGIVLNVFLISSEALADLATKIGGMIKENSMDILELLRTPVVAVALTWFSTIGAMLLASTFKINQQTTNAIVSWFGGKNLKSTEPTFESVVMNDINGIKKGSKEFLHAPFESAKNVVLFFTAPITLPAYYIARVVYTVVIRPIAFMIGGPLYLLARLFPSKKAERALPTKDELDAKKKLLDGKADDLALEFSNSIDKGANNPEQVALLTNIRDNDVKKLKDSTDTSRTPVARIKEGMEPDQISSCFQSFWHPGGNKVAVLTRKAEALEQEFKDYEAAALSSFA